MLLNIVSEQIIILSFGLFRILLERVFKRISKISHAVGG